MNDQEKRKALKEEQMEELIKAQKKRNVMLGFIAFGVFVIAFCLLFKF